jgi:hypothetical protein
MELKEYEVEINGVETTLLLSDDDAKERGLKGGKTPAGEKQAPAPANKARSAQGDK